MVTVIVVLALFYGFRDSDTVATPPPVVDAAQVAETDPADPAATAPVGDEGGAGIVTSISDLVAESVGSFLGDAGPVDSGVVAAPEGDWTVDSGAVIAALEELEVKGKAPKTGYSRSVFGRAWDDDAPVQWGNNGCDQRSDVLAASLTDTVMRDECIVESGTLHGPYTGKVIQYKRDRNPDVDIDHTVALSHAYQTGAQQWPAEKRLAFANDPINLVAVDASANRQKGDGDAATWLPPNKAYRCTYVAAQVQVKAVYGLWVTQPEKDTMLAVLGQC